MLSVREGKDQSGQSRQVECRVRCLDRFDHSSISPDLLVEELRKTAAGSDSSHTEVWYDRPSVRPFNHVESALRSESRDRSNLAALIFELELPQPRLDFRLEARHPTAMSS